MEWIGLQERDNLKEVIAVSDEIAKFLEELSTLRRRTLEYILTSDHSYEVKNVQQEIDQLFESLHTFLFHISASTLPLEGENILAELFKKLEQMQVVNTDILDWHQQLLQTQSAIEEQVLEEKNQRYALRQIITLQDAYQVEEFGRIEYLSKEVLYQYRDTEHLQEWKEAILHFQQEFFNEEAAADIAKITQYLQTAEQLGQLVITQRKIEAIEVELLLQLENIDTKTEHLSAQLISLLRQNMQKRVKNTLPPIIFAFFVALSAVILAFLFLQKNIISPLRHIANIFAKTQQGDLSQRMFWAGDDEITQVAKGYNHMAEKLEQRYLRLKNERDRFFELSANLFCVADFSGNFLELNPAWEVSLGYRLTELKSIPYLDFIHPDDVESSQKEISRIISGKTLTAFVNRYRTKEGNYRYFQWSAVGFPKEQKIYAVAHDITKQKRYEQKLKKSEQRLQLALQGAREGLWDWHIPSGEVYFSEQWASMLGYRLDEVEGNVNTWEKLVHPKDMPHVQQVLEDHLQGKREYYETEHRVRTKSGQWKWILDHGKVVERDKDGTAIRAVGTHIDITEKKRTEQQQQQLLEQIQKTNAELNDFAYIVSHDLKAPLRAISSLSQWIYDDYQEKLGKEGKKQLQTMLGRVERMHQLIEGILEYSRLTRTQEPLEEVNLQNLVHEVVQFVDAPAHIKICLEDLPTLRVQKTRIFQVFQNLLSNAIKYMDKQQGQIHVSAEEKTEIWQFAISDNGPGIPEKHFAKIFRIFQTLQARDSIESTGIGLTIVKKTIELHGGKIWLESKVGEGTTFYFILPKAM